MRRRAQTTEKDAVIMTHAEGKALRKALEAVLSPETDNPTMEILWELHSVLRGE